MKITAAAHQFFIPNNKSGKKNLPGDLQCVTPASVSMLRSVGVYELGEGCGAKLSNNHTNANKNSLVREKSPQSTM